jgi:hypothetical protein
MSDWTPIAPVDAVIEVLRPVHPLAVDDDAPPLRRLGRLFDGEDAIHRQLVPE